MSARPGPAWRRPIRCQVGSRTPQVAASREPNRGLACCRNIKTAKSERTKRGLRNTAISGRPLNGLNADPVGFFMKPIRLLPAVVLFVAAMCPAFAADPVFPPGVRVGMTPLVGLSRAKSFIGFETEDQSVKVLVTELPAEAYGEVMNAFKANPAGSGGIKPESIETSAGLAYYTAENAKDGATTVRRYSMILPGGTFSGYVAVQIPENATKIYSDDAVRQMFASAVIRKQVPVEEQLGLMPFKIGELSDFKNIRTLAPGAAIILADGDEITVGENDRSARRQRADILEIAEFADLERHQSKLLLDRNLLADHRRGKHLPHRIVGIDFGGILGDLHGDVAGERAARQNHRIAPHRGRAILGVLGGVVGKAGRCLDAFRLDAAAACRIGL